MRKINAAFLDTLSNAYKDAVGTRPLVARQILHTCMELGVIRLDSEEEPESWITVNGNHIPLDKEGVAMGGAGGWAEGKDFGEAKTEGANGREHKVSSGGNHRESLSMTNGKATHGAILSITKRAANKAIQDVWDRRERESNDGNWEERDKRDHDELVSILDEMPPGSKIVEPSSWAEESDDGKRNTYTKDRDGDWRSTWGYYSSPDGMADILMTGDKDEHLTVHSVARSEESKRASLEKQNKTYFRNNNLIWSKRGGEADFDEHMEVKLNTNDRQRIGDGYTLTGADGKTYVHIEGEWRNPETYKKADMRTLRGAKFDGDYFDIAFGLNGFSKEAVGKLRETYKGMPENVRGKYEDIFRRVESGPAYEGMCSHYSPVRRGVFFESDERDPETAIHEYSHAMDDFTTLSNGNKPYQEIEKAFHREDVYHREVGRVANLLGIELTEDGWVKDTDDPFENMDKYLQYAGKASREIPGFSNVSDVISGISGGNFGESLYGGHSSEYWHQPYTRSMEYWAEFCTLKVHGYNEALGLLKQITPERYEAAERVWAEVFGE